MALRAGYYGLKRSIKNKLTLLAASMPADISPDNPIAGKNDVLAGINLLGNTVGWIGKNRFNYKNAVNATNVISGVDMASGDISIKDVTAQWSSTYIGYMDIEKGNIYKLVADKVATYGRFGFSTSSSSYPQSGSFPDDMITFSGPSPQTATKILFNGDISIAAKETGRIYLWFCSDENYQASHQAYTIKIMISDAEEYKLSSAYEPYHDTAAETLNSKVTIGKIITSADDLDNITETGLYGVTTSPVNAPENQVYFTLLVQKTNTGDIRQIIFKGGSYPYIYMRSYGGSTPQWYNWYKFAGAEVTPPSPTPENETKKATKKKVIKEEEE